MISALGCRAAVVLYDGAPILKMELGLDLSPLWKLAEDLRVTHLGVSPKYLATLAAENYRPGDQHDLSALRALQACGVPTLPHQFDWAYDAVKQDMMFALISGGTEILGCFLIGSPIHAVRRGQAYRTRARPCRGCARRPRKPDYRKARRPRLYRTVSFHAVDVLGHRRGNALPRDLFRRAAGNMDPWRYRRTGSHRRRLCAWPLRQHPETGRCEDRHLRNLCSLRDLPGDQRFPCFRSGLRR